MACSTVIQVDLNGSRTLKQVVCMKDDLGGCDISSDCFLTLKTEAPNADLQIRNNPFYKVGSICYRAFYVREDPLAQHHIHPTHPYRYAFLPNHIKDTSAVNYRNNIVIVKRFEPPLPPFPESAKSFDDLFETQHAHMKHYKTLDCDEKDLEFIHGFLSDFTARYGLEP